MPGVDQGLKPHYAIDEHPRLGTLEASRLCDRPHDLQQDTARRAKQDEKQEKCRK